MGPAFASGGRNYTVCHNGTTLHNLTYKQAKRHVNHGDRWGKCNKGRVNIGKVTYKGATGVWR